MSTKPIADLAKELRDEPSQGTLTNVLEGLRGREGQPDQYPALIIEHVRELVPTLRNDEEEVNIALYNLDYIERSLNYDSEFQSSEMIPKFEFKFFSFMI
jgi:hypothetical protein